MARWIHSSTAAAAVAISVLAVAASVGPALAGRQEPGGAAAGAGAGAGGGQLQYVRCQSSTGDLLIEVHPEWAPIGAARFLELVESGFFTESPLFRVKKRFLAQFGIASTPQVTDLWRKKGRILDDPNIGIPVKRGTMAFAGGGKDSRTTEMWIAYRDSKTLGNAFWETPFAQVVEGMEAADNWYDGYGDMKAFGGNAPDQRRLYKEGIAYTKKEYPELSYLLSCYLVGSGGGGLAKAADLLAEEKAAVPRTAGEEPGYAKAAEQNPAEHGLEDLRQLSKALHGGPLAEHSPLLSTTASIGLMSFVVVLVVACVRSGSVDAAVSANKGTPVKDK